MSDSPGPRNARSAIKRARPVHSCINCRNRKLKCDRQKPCTQCTRAGRGDDCVFDVTIGSLSRESADNHTLERRAKVPRLEQSHTPDDHGNGELEEDHVDTVIDDRPRPPTRRIRAKGTHGYGVVEDLEARVRGLEEAIGLNHIQSSSYNTARSSRVLLDGLDAQEDAQASAPPIATGRQDDMIGHFDEAKAFMRDKFKSDPRAVQDIQTLKRTFPKVRKDARSWTDQAPLLHQMSSILPPKPECDRLLEDYFTTWETLQPVLDVTAFYLSYNSFWQNSPDGSPPEGLLPTLLMVTVLSHRSWIDSHVGMPESKTSSFDSERACMLVEQWLSSAREKRVLRTENVCVRALLCTSLFTIGAHPHRLWQATGSLVRSANLAGLNPAIASKYSRPVGDQSRYLWMTIISLDLQSSRLCGMPCMVIVKEIDTIRMQPLIDSVESHFRDIASSFKTHSFLWNRAEVLAKTLKARVYGCEVPFSNDEIDVERLESCREAIQKCRLLPSPPTLHDMFLDMHLHTAVLCINRVLFACHGLTLQEARMSSLRSSLMLLGHLDELDRNLNGQINSMESWELFFTSCRQGIFQAAFIVCFMIHLQRSTAATTTGGARNPYGEWSSAGLIRRLENVLRSLVQNIPHLGNHLKDLVGLSVLLELLRTRSDDGKEAKMAAMDRGFSFIVHAGFDRAAMLGLKARGGRGKSSSNADSDQTSNLDWGFDPSSWPQFDIDFDFGFNFDPTSNWDTGEGNQSQWSF